MGVALTEGPAGAGGARQLALTVRNRGPNPATGVLVSITLSGAADIGSLPAGCRGPADATIVCDLGEIPSSGLVERVLTLRPGSRLTVRAHARPSRGTDEQPTNDRAELTM